MTWTQASAPMGSWAATSPPTVVERRSMLLLALTSDGRQWTVASAPTGTWTAGTPPTGTWSVDSLP